VDKTQDRRWTKYIVTRKEHVKTTWMFRISLLACLVLVGSVTRPLWTRAIGTSLVCDEPIDSVRVDAVLIDNLDWDYLLFERAAALLEAGVTSTVIVPVDMAADGKGTSVARGFVDVMARVARLRELKIVPIREAEPISLNAAVQIERFIHAEKIESVTVITPAFRSRRSVLVYRSVLGAAGVAVHCVPVFGQRTPDNWIETWHGVQDVGLQFLKLQYYRFYVLPFRHPGLAASL